MSSDIVKLIELMQSNSASAMSFSLGNEVWELKRKSEIAVPAPAPQPVVAKAKTKPTKKRGPKKREIKFKDDTAQYDSNFLDETVWKLQLGARARNCIHSWNEENQSDPINTVADLACRSEAFLRKIKGFGTTSIIDVKAALAEHNLTLGMDMPRSKVEKIIEKDEADRDEEDVLPETIFIGPQQPSESHAG